MRGLSSDPLGGMRATRADSLGEGAWILAGCWAERAGLMGGEEAPESHSRPAPSLGVTASLRSPAWPAVGSLP